MKHNNEKARVLNDIKQFGKKIKKHSDGPVKEMAMRYAGDAKFFLQNNDVFTAWGCINYAFGLIDAELEYANNKKIKKT